MPAAAQREPVELDRAVARLKPQAAMQAEAREVKLPLAWNQLYPGQDGEATLLLQLPPRRSDEPYGLFIYRIGNQAEIRIGGTLQKRLGVLGDPASDHAKAPMWIDVPAALLRPDGPTPLEVRLTAQADRWGGMSQLWFGPAALLEPMYRSNERWRQTAAVVIVLSLALMALMAGGLWWRQRDALYGMLALTALFGVIRMGDRLLVQPPLPWPLWGAVVSSAFVLHLMLMARFALQAVGEQGRWIPRGFWAFTVAGVAAAFASFLGRLPWLWTMTLMATALPATAVLACGVRQAWRTRSRQTVLLCATGFMVVLVGFRDLLGVRVSPQGLANFSLMPHAIFVFVLLMGWIVVDRYSQQVAQYRELNSSLERRVAEREKQLDASYRQLARQGEQQAALQERQRIMRDIHDGLGAQLVSLLGLVRNGAAGNDDLHKGLNAALDELRMAVDSLQPVHGDLTTVLATLRYRLQPRLEAAGLQVIWSVQPLPALAALNPRTVLQIQRILLEAFTNVLRHARARCVEISACMVGEPPVLQLEVRDDGVGFAADAQGGGVGLRSMHGRSESIGAKLSIDSVPGKGTCVRLAWSVPSQTE